MTTLTVNPDIAKKRLKLTGKVASGEKVSVTITGFGSASTANLRLRVMAGHVAVGYFPLEDNDSWTVSGSDLTCTLNLSTEQAERICKFGANVCFILEDVGIPQLFGVGDFTLCPWIKLADSDVPVNLDNYKSKIEEISQSIANLQTAINAKYTKPAIGIPKSDLSPSIQTSLGKVDTTLQVHQSLTNLATKAELSEEATIRDSADVDLSSRMTDIERASNSYVNAAEYDSTTKKIFLKHGNSTIAQIDATAFIKDGMVQSVAITDGNLVITFNTEAEQPSISIPLTDIFNPENYYDRTTTDTLLGSKVDAVQGKGLSSNDYTTAEKTKLSGIASGAEVNAIATVKVDGTALTPDANKAVNIDLSGKQDAISDLSSIRSGATAGTTAYQKPSGGIPASDLDSAVRTSLGKADTAVQPESGKGLFSGSYNDLTDKPTIPAAQVNSDWNSSSGVAQILNKPNLATVATSGAYADLSDKPTIPAAQVQSDWNEADTTSKAFIKNKPTIPVVPTNVSAFTNDMEYVTRYSQNAITLPAGTTSLTLTDREANRYDITALTNETVAVTMPTITSGKAADVVVTLSVGADVPTFDWDDTTNHFIANDGADWATLTASKKNVITFTSTGAANEWIVGRVTEA